MNREDFKVQSIQINEREISEIASILILEEGISFIGGEKQEICKIQHYNISSIGKSKDAVHLSLFNFFSPEEEMEESVIQKLLDGKEFQYISGIAEIKILMDIDSKENCFQQINYWNSRCEDPKDPNSNIQSISFDSPAIPDLDGFVGGEGWKKLKDQSADPK